MDAVSSVTERPVSIPPLFFNLGIPPASKAPRPDNPPMPEAGWDTPEEPRVEELESPLLPIYFMI